jgi:hypothetical protein
MMMTCPLLLFMIYDPIFNIQFLGTLKTFKPFLELGVWSLRHNIFLRFETKIRNLKVKFNQKRIQLKSILRNQDVPKN